MVSSSMYARFVVSLLMYCECQLRRTRTKPHNTHTFITLFLMCFPFLIWCKILMIKCLSTYIYQAVATRLCAPQIWNNTTGVGAQATSNKKAHLTTEHGCNSYCTCLRSKRTDPISSMSGIFTYIIFGFPDNHRSKNTSHFDDFFLESMFFCPCNETN